MTVGIYTQAFKVPAMGTVFDFRINLEEAIDKPLVENELRNILVTYENTFSKWSKNSEVSKVVRNHKYPIIISDLLVEFLILSKDLSLKTNYEFNIFHKTVAEKKCNPYETLKIIKNKLFFKNCNPLGFDFDGLIKGSVLAELGIWIYKNLNPKSFYINGGGGNIISYNQLSNIVTFKSYSNKINNISSNYNLKKSTEVICQIKIFKTKMSRNSWIEVSTWADIYSTLLVIKPRKVINAFGCIHKS